MPGKLLARSNYVCIVAWGRERLTRNIRESATPMSPPEEFLKHAAECELMAKFSRRREDKETWRRMAERWLRARTCSPSKAWRHATWLPPSEGAQPHCGGRTTKGSWPPLDAGLRIPAIR